jgi:signal transduction histidine kinase
MIETVTLNLLSNAVKYSPEGETVDVYLETADDGRVAFRVKDNGIGIPKKDQAEIFGKLFRADNAKQVDAGGNGLGLYVCKSFVALVGGEMSFESEAGKGTTFTVIWPENPENRPQRVKPIKDHKE